LLNWIMIILLIFTRNFIEHYSTHLEAKLSVLKTYYPSCQTSSAALSDDPYLKSFLLFQPAAREGSPAMHLIGRNNSVI